MMDVAYHFTNLWFAGEQREKMRLETGRVLSSSDVMEKGCLDGVRRTEA
jgi:hypothetical protein